MANGRQLSWGTNAPRRRSMSLWWPFSFFIAMIVFIIIGVVLANSWRENGSSTSNEGVLYGAVVMLVLGFVCKVIAWTLLIVRCCQNGRDPSPPAIQGGHEPSATSLKVTQKLLSTPAQPQNQDNSVVYELPSQIPPQIPPQELQAPVPTSTNTTTAGSSKFGIASY